MNCWLDGPPVHARCAYRLSIFVDSCSGNSTCRVVVPVVHQSGTAIASVAKLPVARLTQDCTQASGPRGPLLLTYFPIGASESLLLRTIVDVNTQQ
jgi:hypothetical protein